MLVRRLFAEDDKTASAETPEEFFPPPEALPEQPLSTAQQSATAVSRSHPNRTFKAIRPNLPKGDFRARPPEGAAPAPAARQCAPRGLCIYCLLL